MSSESGARRGSFGLFFRLFGRLLFGFFFVVEPAGFLVRFRLRGGLCLGLLPAAGKGGLRVMQPFFQIGGFLLQLFDPGIFRRRRSFFRRFRGGSIFLVLFRRGGLFRRIRLLIVRGRLGFFHIAGQADAFKPILFLFVFH